MLVNAAIIWDEIIGQFRIHSADEKYKYYTSLVNFEPIYDINRYQYAITADNTLSGYVDARIDGRVVRDVSIIAWRNGSSVMRQAVRFIVSLVDERGHSKVVFSCIYNNPICKTVEKMAKHYGARYIGTFCADKIAAGKYRDVIYWELHRNDYLRRKAMIKVNGMI